MANYVNRVQVYDSNISGMFHGDGEVIQEARRITIRIKTRAEVLAPKGRTSKLARSHRRNVVPSGIYGTRGYVTNTAEYAEFVHDGTVGPIRPRTSAALAVGRSGGGPEIARRSVRGQGSQPWLTRAAQGVLLRYNVRLPLA